MPEPAASPPSAAPEKTPQPRRLRQQRGQHRPGLCGGVAPFLSFSCLKLPDTAGKDGPMPGRIREERRGSGLRRPPGRGRGRGIAPYVSDGPGIRFGRRKKRPPPPRQTGRHAPGVRFPGPDVRPAERSAGIASGQEKKTVSSCRGGASRREGQKNA